MKTLIKKFINKETIVYLIFGVLTTAVNYFIFWLFNGRFEVPVLIANVIAFIIAVIFAFITNKIFVFESKSFAPAVFFPEFAGFIGARILSFLFEEGFLAVTTYFHMNQYVSKAIASIVVIILNYFASKFLIFKHKKSKNKGVNND